MKCPKETGPDIYLLISLSKTKIKSFECPKSIKNYEKNNTGNIRRLVDESFDPATQRLILKIVGFYYAMNLLIDDSKSTFYWVLNKCSSGLGTTLVKPSTSVLTFVFQFQKTYEMSQRNWAWYYRHHKTKRRSSRNWKNQGRNRPVHDGGLGKLTIT